MRRTEVVAAWGLGVTALLLILLVWRRCGQGFDLSDEGLYLIWISQAWAYDTSLTQFGYLYSPLYELVRGSVTGLRRASMLITTGLGAAPIWILLRRLHPTSRPVHVAALALALSCATLTAYHQWLPTPNYNTLNMKGLLVTTLGLVLIAQSSSTVPSLRGAWLIGIGGWLCFMAKPTTAILLTPIVLIFIVAVASNRWQALAVAVGSATLLCLAAILVLDGGSIGDHIARYQRALKFAALIGSSHNLMAMLDHSGLVWSPFERNSFLGLAAGFGAIAWAILSRVRLASQIALAVVGVNLLLALSLVTNTAFVFVQRSAMQAVWMGGPAFGLAIAIVARNWRSIGVPTARPYMLLALVLLPFPLIFGFGTGSFVWVKAADAYVSWTIAIVALTSALAPADTLWRLLLALAGGVVGVAALLVAIGIEQPYRQPEPLRLQSQQTRIGARYATLDLDVATATYIATLREGARRFGLVTGTSVIDLTGRHPGTVFALGGDAPQAPWLISGYPGSAEFAKSNLDRAPCATLGRAWLLFSPDGKTKLPDGLLAAYGIDVKADYREAARAIAPTGLGTHFLLVPSRPAAATAACDRIRQSGR